MALLQGLLENIPLERPPSSTGRSVFTSRETSSVDWVGRGCWGTLEPLEGGEVGLEVAMRFIKASRDMPRSIKPRILCLASLRMSAGASLMAPVMPVGAAKPVRRETDEPTSRSLGEKRIPVVAPTDVEFPPDNLILQCSGLRRYSVMPVLTVADGMQRWADGERRDRGSWSGRGRLGWKGNDNKGRDWSGGRANFGVGKGRVAATDRPQGERSSHPAQRGLIRIRHSLVHSRNKKTMPGEERGKMRPQMVTLPEMTLEARKDLTTGPTQKPSTATSSVRPRWETARK